MYKSMNYDMSLLIVGISILLTFIVAGMLIITSRRKIHQKAKHQDTAYLDELEDQMRVMRELIVENNSGVEPLVEAHLTGSDDTDAMKGFSARFATAEDREYGLERYNERYAEQKTEEYRVMLDQEFPDLLRAGILDLREHTPEFSVMITNPTETAHRDTFLLEEPMAHDVYQVNR